MQRSVFPLRGWSQLRARGRAWARRVLDNPVTAASLLALLALTTFAVINRRVSTAAEQSKPQTSGKKAPAAGSGKAVAAGASSNALQTARNLGKAYYEQGKYPEAAAEFRKVIASSHALATDHLDLGMALMQGNDLDAALGELTTAKQMDPKLIAIDYELGILYKRELRYPDAESTLKRVVEADPHDPAAWFNLGTVYSAERKLPEALDAHQHVLEMGFGRGQNFYVASLFHTFTTLTRLKRPAEAQKVLKLHEELRDKVPNISLQNPALEGGKYGAIIVPPVTPIAEIAKTASNRVTLTDITATLGIKLPDGGVGRSGHSAQSLAEQFGPSVAVGDYDGDGRTDVYLVIPTGTHHLFHNNGDGTFTDITEKAGVAGPGGSVSATFADYDNSGHPSLFVAGLHGIALFRNRGNGTFVDETAKAGLAGKPGEFDTSAVLFDADDDGFLDLVVTAYAEASSLPSAPTAVSNDLAGLPVHFYRNNGDGTFKDLTTEAGLGSAKGRMRGAVFADFNNDGYADLLFVRDDGPPLLYLNQGEDKFLDRTGEAGPALAHSKAIHSEVADFNHDGNFDLALWSADGYDVLLNDGKGQFTPVKGLPAVPGPESPLAFRGTAADLDGDGFDDLLSLDRQGKVHFIQNRAGQFEERPLTFAGGPDQPLEFITAAWVGAPAKLDLLSFARNGRFAAFEKAGAAPRWVEVSFDGYKSNKGGVGTVVELKAGNFYKKIQATGGPLRVFTGDLPKLDVVRVTWPNAIVQNSIDVATNKPMQVRESERLASSCPFLYVWDGKEYRFFTDILGVAPLGELLPDGSRIKPNPEDLVKLGDRLQAHGGALTFQVTDEMRETDYVDQLRLIAVDHPESEEVYSNEIYSSAPEPPALYAVSKKRFPVTAVDDQGRDVLPLIRERDGRYPTAFRRNRILGLADLHSLTLDLGEFPKSQRVALYLNGWVFWTDSNASRALMSNPSLQMVAPYLQVRDSLGNWVTALPDMGLPSGTNRTVRVDLTGKFPSADHHVRIVTNFCVYWDQIFVAFDDRRLKTGLDAESGSHESAGPVGIELPLATADLHYRGFSTPSSDPEHLRPDRFDYIHLMSAAPWNPFLGHYTRYGAVDELVKKADDRLVVLATGDEMTVRFSARNLGELKRGWKRDFFLYARGYAKDGEPNTAYFRTAEPLPFWAMRNYPYEPPERYPDTKQLEEYRREYETRPARALIPPLAPALR